MMGILLSFISGLIFAIGLVVSGMTNPLKVQGFLDIFSLHGPWDISLIFVMGGAVGINYFTFKFLTKRKPFCSPKHFLPEKVELDRPLIFGSLLFGAGWGLLGVCPGPGLVNLVTSHQNALLFVGSMLVGMMIFQMVNKKWN